MSYKSQTITAVVLTHNHGKVLERCLDSLKFVDDMVILDQGSTDNTLELAKRYTQRIYFHPSEDLATRRNYAYGLVKTEWVLSIEPYEWVEEMLRHEIDGVLLNIPPDLGGFAIGKQFHFQGQAIGRPQAEVRLFRKGAGKVHHGPHDHTLSVRGNVQRLDRPFGSEPYSNLQQWVQDINYRSTQAAYQALEAGKTASGSVWGMLLKLKLSFAVNFLLKQGFQDGFHGLTMALAAMMEQYLTHVKLRSLTRSKI